VEMDSLVLSRRPAERKPEMERRWLRSGYLLIAALLLFRLWYISSGIIELSNDEAYQWLWSKHLALSYFSKPPGIAFIQFAGTSLWGDTQLGVRFFSPVFAAILSLVTLGFLTREVGARPAFLVLLIITSAPLMSLGTVVMTIDPPLVLCWTLAMIAGWRAVQPGGTTRQWLLAGLAAGLGFLCKYSAAYLLVCWAVFFLLRQEARVHLRRPGPYLALLVFALCTLPVIVWNAQHGWITVSHVGDRAGMNSNWRPTLKYFWDFLCVNTALLNPIFFVGALWSMVGLLKSRRENPLGVYLFCMGGLVFLGHWAFTLHSKVQPNWVAPAVLPMLCWMVIYWDVRWQEGLGAVKAWLIGGLVLGCVVVVFMHQTDLIGQIAGHQLPGDADPLRRVRGYKETAAAAEEARQKLLREGKPTFIICDHYGLTGLFSFYLPEAKAALRTKPLVYCQPFPKPASQLDFWPEYHYENYRKGENAIFICEPPSVTLEKNWLWKWLRGKEVGFAEVPAPAAAAPVLLAGQFESVTNLGVQEILLRGRVMKRVQLFECRNLR
jgi:hypothetical protein